MAQSVLVVDDEPSILLALEFMMKNAGFDVRTARDGEEALKALAEKRPDLLLLDVMMPPPDGYDVCQRVRADPRATVRRFADLLEVDHERVRLWMFARAAAEPRDVWDGESLALARLLA